MESTTKQKEFIQLRAQGLSFSKIAERLNVSKQTLIKWSGKFKEEIHSLRAIEIEGLIYQYDEADKMRLEKLLKLKQRILKEIENRDFKDCKTIDLFNLLNQTENNIKQLRDKHFIIYRESIEDFKLEQPKEIQI